MRRCDASEEKGDGRRACGRKERHATHGSSSLLFRFSFSCWPPPVLPCTAAARRAALRWLYFLAHAVERGQERAEREKETRLSETSVAGGFFLSLCFFFSLRFRWSLCGRTESRHALAVQRLLRIARQRQYLAREKCGRDGQRGIVRRLPLSSVSLPCSLCGWNAARDADPPAPFMRLLPCVYQCPLRWPEPRVFLAMLNLSLLPFLSLSLALQRFCFSCLPCPPLPSPDRHHGH